MFLLSSSSQVQAQDSFAQSSAAESAAVNTTAANATDQNLQTNAASSAAIQQIVEQVKPALVRIRWWKAARRLDAK
jgi:hypothetical protein